MKKTLILLMIVTLTSFAQAQDDTVGNVVERPVRFQGLIDVGLGMHIPDPFLKTPEFDLEPYLDLEIGIKVKNRAFIGAGVGFSNRIYRYYYQHRYQGLYNREWHWMPLLTFSLRGDVYVTDRNGIRPYVSTTVGCQVGDYDWFRWYVKTGAGLDYKQFTLSIGCMGDIDIADHIIYLEFGYRFNTHKYDQAHKR